MATATPGPQVTLTWNPEVMDVVTKGYNVRYGARSIQHEVDRKVISQLAAYHELDKIKPGCKVHVTANKKTDEVYLKVMEGDKEGGILPSGALASLKKKLF